jgi:P-type conjugative transfer protein TrbJ
MKKTIIAITSAVLIAALPLSSPGTGIPVVDVSVIAQAIKQGLTQIQQYTTQLSQLQTEINTYKNQILQATGIAQVAQIYSQVQGVQNQLTGTVNMFRSGAGLNGYLQNFKDVNYWMTAPSGQYSGSNGSFWSTNQKTANSQLVNEISQQEQQIQADSQLLSRLQSQSGSISTQRQALDVANELASLQQKQLLELRILLVASNQAIASRNGTVANDEAMRQANTQNFLNSTQSVSQPHTGWSPVLP